MHLIETWMGRWKVLSLETRWLATFRYKSDASLFISRVATGDTSAVMNKTLDENERFRQGIADYLSGNYGPRTRKTETCAHGLFGYEECAGCTAEHFMKVLGVPADSCPTCKSPHKKPVPIGLLAKGEKRCRDEWHSERTVGGSQ